MAISKLDFARGQVVNPLGSIGDDLLKFGSSLHQQEKDRLAAERQNEMLNMQKQEHQMKLEEQARQLAETDNYKKFVVGLNAPKEMAEASALYNQNNNPILQKQVNDMAFAPTDTPEDVARKTKLQEDLGKFGSTMSAMPEFKETEYQKAKRILAEMGDKAPLAGIKQLREMEAAQIASDAAKSKDLTETVKHAQDGLLKLEIEAMKQGKGGGVTVNDDGSYTINGGSNSNKTYNPAKFEVKQLTSYGKDDAAGKTTLYSGIERKGAGKATDLTSKQQDILLAGYNKYVGEGYNPTDIARVLVANTPNDPAAWQIWKDNPKEITLTPEQLKQQEPGKLLLDKTRAAELKEAQFDYMASQAKNSEATGAEILKAYGPVYQNQIAKAEADKALLALTPEQRQAQATMSYLGKIMAPKAEATGDKTTKGNSAETVDVTNMVPKLRTIVDDTVDTVVDKHGGTHIAGVALATMGVAETGGDLNASGDGGTAKGLYQHRGERLDALKKFGKTDKVETIPHNTQTDFAVSELKSRPATKEFADAYKKDNPDAKFVSQWDELNSKKTAGEAAAYLSEYFEVAKGNSKNPNIVEARREEAARRAKMAEAMYANDYDEFGQNKRRIGKVEEEMIKSGPKGNEKQLSSLEVAAEGDPYSLVTLSAKADLAALEKNKKSFSAEMLAKPARDWSDSEIKKASVLPDIAKDKRDWTLFDIASSIGGNTPMKQDPAKTKALRLLEDRKQDIGVDATKEESGLESSNLEVLPLGKIAKTAGSTALTGLQYAASKTPILNKVISAPVLPAPKIIESVSETLKRANDFNKIGIWRELRSRGVEVTDAMVEEILRKGNIFTR